MSQVSPDLLPSWLPKLILFEDHRGRWDLYIESIYNRYLQDFVERKVYFRSTHVFVRFEPSYELKGATFWHIISEGKEESERQPNIRRCERIGWPRAIIENPSSDVKIYETIRSWKGQQQKRINFILNDFSYLVVLAINGKRIDLVTAYPIERSHEREKKRREYENYLQMKKGGAAV
jgi:hypothetical protein